MAILDHLPWYTLPATVPHYKVVEACLVRHRTIHTTRIDQLVGVHPFSGEPIPVLRQTMLLSYCSSYLRVLW